MTTVDQSPGLGSWWQSCALFVVAFLLILWARWEVVDSPPYYDFAYGIWREADFLARTGFDYWDLRYNQAHSLPHGGPRSYMTSVVPSGLALLLLAFPDSALPRILYHLATFAGASLVIVLTVRLVRPRLNVMATTALALAMATTPVFCVQIDMTGMEIFATAATMLSVWSVHQQRWTLAAAWSFVVFLVKPTGMIVTFALLTLVAAQWMLSRPWSSPNRQRFRRISLPLGFFVLEMAILRWGGTLGAQIREGLSPVVAAIWSPDVLVLVAVSAVVLLMAFFRTSDLQASGGAFWRRTAEWLDRHAVIVYSFGIICGVLMALTRVGFVPRYLAIVVPLAYVIVGGLWPSGMKARKLATVLFLLIAGANVWNWNGALYPAIGPNLQWIASVAAPALEREGAMLERSHEYLPNHRANIEACQQLEEFAEDPIIAPLPFSMFLAHPEMGYVSRPIYVYSIYSIARTTPESKTTSDLLIDRPKNPVCVIDSNYYTLALSDWEVPSPGDTDKHIFGDERGMAPLIYRKGWGGASPSPEKLKSWYDMGSRGPRRTAGQLFYHMDRGERDALKSRLEAMRDWPPPGSPRFILADVLAQEGEVQQATIEWLAAIKADPGFARRIQTEGIGNREQGTVGKGSPLGGAQLEAGEADEWEERGKARLADLDLVGACDAFGVAAACRMPQARKKLTDLLEGGKNRDHIRAGRLR